MITKTSEHSYEVRSDLYPLPMGDIFRSRLSNLWQFFPGVYRNPIDQELSAEIAEKLAELNGG